MAIGYRMLGSVQEAEDLVQDAWLRWHDEVEGARAAVLVPEAWLAASGRLWKFRLPRRSTGMQRLC